MSFSVMVNQTKILTVVCGGLYVTRFLHYFIKLGNDHLTFRGRLCFLFFRQILHAKKNKMN